MKNDISYYYFMLKLLKRLLPQESKALSVLQESHLRVMGCRDEISFMELF